MSLAIIFLMQLVQAILMLVFLKRLNQVKKEISTIIEEVKTYIQFVTEEEEAEEIKKNMHKAEDQSQLLHAVLREYFP